MLNCFYYDQNGNKYSTKIDAVNSGQDTQLYFFDKEFDNVPWKIEPQESLKELYRIRAQQIRDEYSYVILAYSGGIDSTNILETFYYNNIKIDEILMVGSFAQDSHYGDDSNHNGELYYNAFPLLKKLELNNTKITVVDYSKLFEQNINNFSLSKQNTWEKEVSAWYSAHHWYWHDVFDTLNVKRRKKVALIYGIDKPHLHNDENGHFTRFTDLCILDYGTSTFFYDQNTKLQKVNFYWDPAAESIIRKQVHTISRFRKENVETGILSVQDYSKNFTNIMHKLIYDIKNPLVFVSPKSKTRYISLRDTWILKNKDSDLYKLYSQKIGNLITNNKYNLPVFTKKYYISN